ncbi:MAG: DUF2752 domain-containing protein [Deltaproteobacteria bacterium]|nr:DUF2752 domain-containing protein [Deltaproteobacteria bacterium]
MCAIQYFLGVPCPGCGFLHALWAVGHLRFAESFHLFPIWPLLILLFPWRGQKWVGHTFLVALFGQWFLRILFPL